MSDELMSAVEHILKGALDQVRTEKGEEMKRVLAQLVQASSAEGLVPKGQEVLLYMMSQTNISDIDPDKVRLSEEQKGKTVEQLEAEGNTGGTISMPFTFQSYDEALDNLSSPWSAILADYSQGGRPWATVTCHKEQGTTVYILVAGNCLTIHKVLPTGDNIASFHDPDTSDAEAVEKALYTHGKAIAKAQYTFTSHIQMLKKQYPETYSTMLKQVLERMKEGEDDDS